MSNHKAIPFKAAHIECMDIREQELNLLNSNPKFLRSLPYLESEKCAITIISKGIVIAVLGYIELQKGVFEIWLIPSKHIYKDSIAFARLVWYYKNTILEHFDWHRLQVIAADDDLHNRWVRFLKFEREGLLRSWGPDKQDFVIWSIVR